MPSLDIRPDHLHIVCDILQTHVPNREVWAFGSRAKWTARETSDLDLCVQGNQPLSFESMGLLRAAFEESDLPYKVDVVDWAITSDAFREIIERDKVVVQNGWRDGVLGDCIYLKSGGTPSKSHPEFWNGSVPWFSAKDMKSYWLDDSEDHLTKAGEEAATRIVEPGTTLLLVRGMTLHNDIPICRVKKPAAFNQDVKAVFPTNDVVRDFVPCLLRGNKAKLLGLVDSAGHGTGRLNTDTLLALPIRIPPKSSQRAIAHILGSLDDKIELNRRINQTLEEMAQAIFKSWFVDFDPVKAKVTAQAEGRDPLRAAMRAISGKTDAELDALPREQYDQLAATAALFPEEMEESDIGDIPKGWHVRSMPECIDVNPIRQLKKGTVAPYLDMANVPTNSVRARNVVPREFSSGSKFLNGDTLLARITPCLENGKTAFVDFLDEKQIGWGSTEFIVLRPKSQLPVEFAYFLARHAEFRSFSIAQMAGTSGRQRVPNDCFNNYFLVEPSREPAKVFGVLAKSVLNEIKSLDKSSQLLEQLRDSLLPKLLSGELSVTDIASPADKAAS